MHKSLCHFAKAHKKPIIFRTRYTNLKAPVRHSDGDRFIFIIDHWLELVNAFDAILPIIIGSHISTELSTLYALEGNSGASGFFLCPCVKGNNWFSYITLGKTYCQSSRRLSVSETSLPCGLVVHINLVIACFVQASDD